jgi:hypothetical protein
MDSRLKRVGGYSLGLLIAFFAVGGHVLMAQSTLPPAPLAAPEIDGASIASGLGLLAAGMMILKSRWK